MSSAPFGWRTDSHGGLQRDGWSLVYNQHVLIDCLGMSAERATRRPGTGGSVERACGYRASPERRVRQAMHMHCGLPSSLWASP